MRRPTVAVAALFACFASIAQAESTFGKGRTCYVTDDEVGPET